MITRQKVSAVLRKAGLTVAKYNRSGMVRGWGDWSEGYRVSYNAHDNILFVRHEQSYIRSTERTQVYKLGKLAQYKEILQAAGIKSEIQDNRLIVL